MICRYIFAIFLFFWIQFQVFSWMHHTPSLFLFYMIFICPSFCLIGLIYFTTLSDDDLPEENPNKHSTCPPAF